MSDIKVSIRNLYKIFGPRPSKAMALVNKGVGKQELLEEHGHVLGLQNINLDLQEKNIEVIMGLSGSGKSTLIRHINRLLEPTSGNVIIDGEDIIGMTAQQLRSLRQHKVSMVFQKFALMPHRTILENVQFGLRLSKDTNQDEITEKSIYWLERVGLKGVEDHYPSYLSGGMQQRVGLARALATDGDILLMDEAFSALDPLIRTEMQNMLLELQDELHKTIVFITHDLDEALRIGDRIAMLNDGAVVQQGTAQQILLNPEDDYVRSFVADVNRVKVLRVDSIMSSDPELLSQADDSRPLTIQSGKKVEHLLNKVVLTDPSSIWVANKQGERIGHISRDALAETIGRDEEAEWNMDQSY